MIKSLRLILPVCLICYLLGCASIKQYFINASLNYQLQPVPEQFNLQSWQQVLEFEGQGSFICQIEFVDQQMNLVALSAAGLPLMQLTWSAQSGVNLIQPPPFELNPQLIIRDIQLTHWPVLAVQSGLPASISVRQIVAENVIISRSIETETDKLIDIRYFNQNIEFNDLTLNYRLFIKQLN
ncbi:DUF3261 domain-containing protein [Catenovulum sp. 2E275]|uniref:DUF3261 domain-containing protein n=1 Tax=Catenovulum sp. 2E275 TaxID=2980497 RepID=UPI0021D3E032|nr:DUF3261 domain-containing protein [Catenovulum sp. 2E275]MCU4676650.1 DUF3261 domain-containing protein [Catenovulum sp. 2E275]